MIESTMAVASGTRFSAWLDGVEVGHAYLYLMHNDAHREPFGLLEDVFVEEAFRSGGHGIALVQRVIEAAKSAGCYKLVATSRLERPRVHALYERLGFTQHGFEFRMQF